MILQWSSGNDSGILKLFKSRSDFKIKAITNGMSDNKNKNFIKIILEILFDKYKIERIDRLPPDGRIQFFRGISIFRRENKYPGIHIVWAHPDLFSDSYLYLTQEIKTDVYDTKTKEMISAIIQKSLNVIDVIDKETEEMIKC